MTYYAGLDVALRTVAICIVDDKGTVALERPLSCYLDMIASVEGLSSPYRTCRL